MQKTSRWVGGQHEEEYECDLLEGQMLEPSVDWHESDGAIATVV